jgi:hypothetical protein
MQLKIYYITIIFISLSVLITILFNSTNIEGIIQNQANNTVTFDNSTTVKNSKNITEKSMIVNLSKICSMPPCPKDKVCIQVCPESLPPPAN